MLQVASSSPGRLSLPVSDCRYRLKEFVVNWFRHDGFGSHVGDRLGLAMVILLSFALCIALLKVVFWLVTRERGTDESEDKSEKEYWRIHGG